ncbi:MAG: isovaleryl-CoA dehydrogenase [Alphaproteobacteria bacterium]|nr:isovaleryl-CoA dehydrogenase [Alphaproteobacteria bacterium]
MPALPPFATHMVENQPPALVDYELYATDPALQEAVAREDAGWAAAELAAWGRRLGSAEAIDAGFQANQNPPRLLSHDRQGNRLDRVEFHPAYHWLMQQVLGQGLHTGPWAAPRPGAHVARAAGVILAVQIEAGVQCPTTMTYASYAALRQALGLLSSLSRPLLSRQYDHRFLPIADKAGITIGMGMTEKQGGSDLRTNSTAAGPAGDGAYRLTGHKWFLSAPMSDAFLVLARAPGGLTCCFVPRVLPDGRANALRLQRLKPKLGNHANASAEVEFEGAHALPVGEEGRGIPTIIEMATYTRLDCALGSTGVMRQAVVQALHHARHRTAFQRRLVDQPLMAAVLADLALESEAATALSLRLARAFDRQDDAAETAFRRLMTPVAKYWICKRGPALAAEAMEVLGGGGYVEESILPRLYRELPVNSIWEGSGNVMCLDVLRALAREPGAAAAFEAELAAAAGLDRRYDAFLAELRAELGEREGLEGRARRLVERMALAVQAGLLLRFAPAAVAEAFLASRLAGAWSGAFGTLPRGADVRAIVDRAWAA